jgi:hypothetical protein
MISVPRSEKMRQNMSLHRWRAQHERDIKRKNESERILCPNPRVNHGDR